MKCATEKGQDRRGWRGWGEEERKMDDPRKEEGLKHDGGSTHGRSSLHSYIARSRRTIRTWWNGFSWLAWHRVVYGRKLAQPFHLSILESSLIRSSQSPFPRRQNTTVPPPHPSHRTHSLYKYTQKLYTSYLPVVNLYLQVSDPIYAERNASSSSSDTKFRFFNSSQYCVVSLLISSFETLQRKCCGTVHLCSPISFQLMAMAATSLQLPLTTLFKMY